MYKVFLFILLTLFSSLFAEVEEGFISHQSQQKIEFFFQKPDGPFS